MREKLGLTSNIPIGIFSAMRYDNYAKAERTKSFIIEKVAPVFNIKGYSATSISDLTAATGLSKGSIYGNFKNKDDVAIAAFHYNAGFIVKLITERIVKAQNCRERLLAYPETYRKISKSVLSNGGCPVLNTSVESSGVNSRLRSEACKMIEKWKRSLVVIILKGIKEKEFSPKTNATQVAEVVISLVEGGYAMSRSTGELSYIENSLAQIESIIQSL